MKKLFLSLMGITSLALLLVACQPQVVEVPVEVTRVVTETVVEEVEVTRVVEGETVIETVVEEVEVTRVVEVEGPKSVDTDLANMTWDEVLAEADGQTVTWYHWGGSDTWNNFMDVQIAEQAMDCCNVTVEFVHVNDTGEAINRVLGEAEAGKTEGGSVDMIWINAENFITLRQPDLLFGPYAGSLPNVQYIDTDGGYYNFDAGWPISGYESLWGTSQLNIEYDSARVNPPTNIDDFMEYICTDEARGLFTYPAPPDFTGTGFITGLLYHYTGETDFWVGRASKITGPFEEQSPALWEKLNEVEECLWREGRTYPNDVSELRELVKNGEVAFSISFGVGNIDVQIEDGVYPETMRQMMFDEGMVANAHYQAIPFNSDSKAGAMVVANLLQAPENQFTLTNDIGSMPAVVVNRLPDEVQADFAALELSEARLPIADFAPALPQLGDLQPILENGWRANVLEQ